MRRLLTLLTGNSYALPLVVFAVGTWRIFVPQLPVNEGLGWDGYKYYLLAVNGLQSPLPDSYLALRVLPSLLVHICFQLLGIAFSPENVLLAFKIGNTLLITCGAWMTKKIFDAYRLSPIAQVTGFALVFLNYGVLNFTYYYPVMTDTPAFFLGLALFYFFVKGELLNIMLCGLLGVFTFPPLLLMAAALLLFPHRRNEYLPIAPSVHTEASLLSAGYIVAVGIYFLFMKGEQPEFQSSLPISTGMLPASFAALGLLYFFLPAVLLNKTFATLDYYRANCKVKQIAAIALLFAAVVLLKYSLKVESSSEYLSFYHQLKIHVLYAFQRPFISLVSHYNYFGCVIVLLLVFWRRFAAFTSTFGLGVAGMVFFNLFFFAAKPESRVLIFFFPWLALLLTLFLGKFRFPNLFYGLVLLLNFATAKLWLFFDYRNTPLLSDGTIDFPMQWFFMHLGIWMNERAWLYLCLALGLSLSVFIVCLYRIRLSRKGILFFKRFESLPDESER